MKTPVAMTAITAQDIETYSPRDLNDIAVMVPSLSAGTVSAFKSASFAMRGVSETSIIVYKESPVGVTIDDFVVNHVQTQNLEMFDIQQIEVLRGPQGTLFGKNTTGGTINVKTKRPDHDLREVDVRFELGDFGTQKATLALNVPIIKDQLSFRFAGQQLQSDGYYKNGSSYGPLNIPRYPCDEDGPPADNGNYQFPACGGATGLEGETGHGNGSDLGGDDVLSLRAKLLWSPTENFNALFQYEMIEDEGDSPPVVNESTAGYVFDSWGFPQQPGDPLDNAAVTNDDRFLFNMSRGHLIDIEGFYLNMDWKIGDFTLYSVTGQREQESHLPSTYTGEVFRTLFDATRDDERETFQQEIRLVSEFDGPLNFVAGLYHQQEDIDFCVMQIVGFVDFLAIAVPDGSGGFTAQTDGRGFSHGNPLLLCNAQEAEANAAFLDGTYDVNDRFHISAGLRYTDEEKDWTGRPRMPVQQIKDGTFGGPTWQTLGDTLNGTDWGAYPHNVIRDSEDWQEWTYRLRLAYDFNDDLFGWAGYARGFKSGGYNDQVGTVLNPIPALAARPTDPEIADSFELGVKAGLMGGAANVQLTSFYVVYEDAQRTFNASFPTGQETLFFNAAELEVKGLEFEGSWAVTDSLLLRGSWMWQDAEFNEFRADTNYDGSIDVDLSGNTPTRAPDSMFTIDGTYSADVALGDLDFNLRVAYEDESIASYSDVSPQFDTTLNDRTVWDGNVTFTHSSGNWWVRGVGKNLTDERYRTGSLSVANLWIMSAYAPPRYFGLEVGGKFEF